MGSGSTSSQAQFPTTTPVDEKDRIAHIRALLNALNAKGYDGYAKPNGCILSPVTLSFYLQKITSQYPDDMVKQAFNDCLIRDLKNHYGDEYSPMELALWDRDHSYINGELDKISEKLNSGLEDAKKEEEDDEDDGDDTVEDDDGVEDEDKGDDEDDDKGGEEGDDNGGGGGDEGNGGGGDGGNGGGGPGGEDGPGGGSSGGDDGPGGGNSGGGDGPGGGNPGGGDGPGEGGSEGPSPGERPPWWVITGTPYLFHTGSREIKYDAPVASVV